jgi:hypothetical protein
VKIALGFEQKSASPTGRIKKLKKGRDSGPFSYFDAVIPFSEKSPTSGGQLGFSRLTCHKLHAIHPKEQLRK